jgi:proteasome lid subunit RPN8/RPN11
MSEPSKQQVILPQALWDEIVAHAREGKLEEICGILRGRGNEAFELVRGINEAEDKIDNYSVDAKSLLLQFEFEDAGDEMMGIYHSHPISVAYPSATDAWNAHYPDSIYFICSLEFDDKPVIRAFSMLPNFMDLDLKTLTHEILFEEVRPGLFGHFIQDPNRTSPLLAQVTDEVAPPFYIVYAVQPDTGLDEAEPRVVSIVEHPIVGE